jgi:hypothetical protein
MVEFSHSPARSREAEASKVGEAGKNGTAAALAAYQEVLAARAKA